MLYCTLIPSLVLIIRTDMIPLLCFLELVSNLCFAIPALVVIRET